MNENLCLIDGVEKVVGRSPLRWNRQRSEVDSSSTAIHTGSKGLKGLLESLPRQAVGPPSRISRSGAGLSS